MSCCKYVDEDGNLRLEVVLSAIDVIVAKCPCEDILEASLHLLDCIRGRLDTMDKVQVGWSLRQ